MHPAPSLKRKCSYLETVCLPVTRSQVSRTAPFICSHVDVPRCS